jgi:arylformamidase
MSTLDLETEYDNRGRVPEYDQIAARWAEASKTFRASAKAELGLAYGKGDRHRYDLFHAQGAAAGAEAPLVAYIHGGYWQRGEREANAWVARQLTGKGCAVALASYTLCPATTVMGIVEEMRQFIKALHERTKQRPVVVGHSAGGHLAAAMLATDWGRVGGVPTDLVRAAYAISGVYDLPPLVSTSLNAALKLDASSAAAASPLKWAPPPASATLVAAVGGLESREFIRQSLDIVQVWGKAGVKTECVVVPSANHFTVLEPLADPESGMVARIAALARHCAL